VISRATRSFWDAYEELNAAQKAYRLFEENTVCGGRARVDCIGRMVMRPSDREIASQSRTQYNVRGRRWIDCNGCMVRQPSGREIASQFAVVFAAIKELITAAEPTKKTAR